MPICHNLRVCCETTPHTACTLWLIMIGSLRGCRQGSKDTDAPSSMKHFMYTSHQERCSLRVQGYCAMQLFSGEKHGTVSLWNRASRRKADFALLASSTVRTNSCCGRHLVCDRCGGGPREPTQAKPSPTALSSLSRWSQSAVRTTEGLLERLIPEAGPCRPVFDPQLCCVTVGKSLNLS